MLPANYNPVVHTLCNCHFNRKKQSVAQYSRVMKSNMHG